MSVRRSALPYLVTVAAAAGAHAIAQRAPVFTVEDMLAVQSLAAGQAPAASPAGRWIAYAVTDSEDEWNIQEPRPTSHIFVQAIGGSTSPRPLTTGATHSAFPVWSPDGTRLAFVREDASGGRLVVWDPESNRMTSVGEPFTARAYLAPQWHPSGRSILFASPVEDEPPPPYRVRVVRSTDARIPGDRFFTDERRATLMAVDLENRRARSLGSDPSVLRSFRVSPKGDFVAYVSPSPDTLGIVGKEQNETFVLAIAAGASPAPRKLPERGRFAWAPDGSALLFSKGGRLMSMPAAGGNAKPWREAFTLAAGDPIWSPDGSRFATLIADPTVTDPELELVAPGMYTTAQPFMDVYIVGGDGTARNLTSAFDDQISDPVWSLDGSALYFRAVNNQTYDETLYRYTIRDDHLEAIAHGRESYARLTATPGGIVATVEDATHPPDLWALERGRTRITDLNPQLRRFVFSSPDLFSFHSADGERLGALLYKPVGMGAQEKVPVITWVYEKMTPALHRFNARDQMIISHGYAMLMPNVKVKVGQTADSFEKCVIPAVNAVRAMGFTNGRFGLWGHSFGAYATSNLITRTSIFDAAVSGATPPELFRNWASGRDRDSRNIETGQARMGGSPFQYPMRYLSQSAFFHLDQVTTPVLILHGEKDQTILFGEGEMMFYALRQLGKTAELVAYANGDHSLSRHSRADAIDVNRRIVEWFDRYLKVASASRSQ